MAETCPRCHGDCADPEEGGPESGPTACRVCGGMGVIDQEADDRQWDETMRRVEQAERAKMRRLTEDEITKEVMDIETRAWPLGDVLHMKQLNVEHRYGTIFRVAGVITPTVHELPHIDENDPKHEFPSLEVMVRAGWIVD